MSADRLTIALVTDWCPPRIGGIERQVAGLARALAARGHTVHLFTSTPGAAPLDGVVIHPVPVPLLGEVAAPQLWRLPELRRLLCGAAPDVVHAHGMFSTLAIGGLLAAHGAGIPSITTHHSLLSRSPTLPAAWVTYRLFSRRATIVSGVSRAAAADARRVSGRRDVAVLPNGFDRTAWQRWCGAAGRTAGGTQTFPRGEPLRVASVMRLARKKSPQDLVDAVPLVRARAGRPVVFTIVGDGPERRRLERRARELGVAAHVEFVGACDPPQVAAILARSHLFALPGAREAFGLALLEARAAGLPVVARAAGGVPELVEHGRHGILVPTPRAFAEAVAALAADDDRRSQLAAAAAEGLEAFDWDRVVDRHEAVYRRALARV